MNTIFKLIFVQSLFLSLAYGKVLIENHGDPQTASFIKKKLEKDYSIPASLIDIKHVQNKSNCQMDEETLYHFCITSKNKLEVLKFDNSHYARTFSVFRGIRKLMEDENHEAI